MLCPVLMSEEARSPQLMALLAEDPYVVPPKESKRLKRKGGPCIREPSKARSKDTHSCSSHDEEEEKEEEAEENTGEGAPSPKGKRAVFEDAEEEVHPQAHKRLHKASADQVG